MNYSARINSMGKSFALATLGILMLIRTASAAIKTETASASAGVLHSPVRLNLHQAATVRGIPPGLLETVQREYPGTDIVVLPPVAGRVLVLLAAGFDRSKPHASEDAHVKVPVYDQGATDHRLVTVTQQAADEIHGKQAAGDIAGAYTVLQRFDTPSKGAAVASIGDLQPIYIKGFEKLGVAGELIPVRPGTFRMGSSREEIDRFDPEGNRWFEDEMPSHEVTFRSGLWVAATKVTQALYEEVMGRNPSHFKGPNRPVENVAWYDGAEFFNKLSEREGLEPAYKMGKIVKDRKTGSIMSADVTNTTPKIRDTEGYRHGTEAEGENWTRADSRTAFSNGDDPRQLGQVAVYNQGETADVATKEPNAWGFYDVHGNAWEWRHDGKRQYTAEAVEDPVGPEAGSRRAIRGGSLLTFDAGRLRSAARRYGFPGGRDGDLGLRPVRSIHR